MCLMLQTHFAKKKYHAPAANITRHVPAKIMPAITNIQLTDDSGSMVEDMGLEVTGVGLEGVGVGVVVPIAATCVDG